MKKKKCICTFDGCSYVMPQDNETPCPIHGTTSHSAQHFQESSNGKDTNPKDAVGTKKVPISVLSFPVLGEVALAMLEGAIKYGRHNYRVAGVRASVYIDAAIMRHLMPFWEGEDIDSDSGLSHITKAIAGLMVLRDSMIQKNWVDDRPPKSPDGWKDELNKKAEEIIKKYPNAKEPYTELNKEK